MDRSIFADESQRPSEGDLVDALGYNIKYWTEIKDYVCLKYPKAFKEWNFPGQKYGWSFRIKDKKRAIIYLLPRDRYFKVAFVFGQKATDEIMNSNIASEIKDILESARVYAEGRGIRIDVTDNNVIEEIKKLVDIKLSTNR